MAKKKEAEATNDAAEQLVEVPKCKRCKKPIKNPNGDNGCGIHTFDGKTVTNCVPE